jgi:hypothetical protein
MFTTDLILKAVGHDSRGLALYELAVRLFGARARKGGPAEVSGDT